MLINFDKTGRVNWYNTEISQKEADSYLSENTIWFDGNMPELEHKNGYFSIFYIDEDMKSIHVEYEPIPEPEPTMEEEIYAAVRKNQDELRQEGADMMMSELVKRGLMV